MMISGLKFVITPVLGGKTMLLSKSTRSFQSFARSSKSFRGWDEAVRALLPPLTKEDEIGAQTLEIGVLRLARAIIPLRSERTVSRTLSCLHVYLPWLRATTHPLIK